MPRNRLTVLLACATLVPLTAIATSTQGASAQQNTSARAESDGYSATITRTSHGIPHVTADNFGSLGFGSGYAAAETSICTLADTLVTARAQRSRWFGPEARYNDQVTLEASNLQVDAFVQDLHNRKIVEKLLADEDRGPGPQAKEMVRGYVAGVNRYLERVGPRRGQRPRVPGRRLPPAGGPSDRPLVRRLHRQPARLQRGVREGDRRR